MGERCTVCLEDGCEDTLPCGHAVHKGCLEEWTRYQPACPVCGRSCSSSTVKCRYCPREWKVEDAGGDEEETVSGRLLSLRAAHEAFEHPLEFHGTSAGPAESVGGGGLGGRGWQPGDPIVDDPGDDPPEEGECDAPKEEGSDRIQER
eukprot:Hpha_TRINITY_DN22871_c0_g1::TRINITY_DN22871_c0_g1_i1::g.84383::m.84383